MINFALALTFAIAWGIAENRLFKEQGEWTILSHFKQYHVFLGFITFIIAILGAEASLLKFIFILIWTPLALDITWWTIRYFDFKADTTKAANFYNEYNAWHMQKDWDNYGKLPLIQGTYAWWWISTFALVVILTIIIAI